MLLDRRDPQDRGGIGRQQPGIRSGEILSVSAYFHHDALARRLAAVK
jgi:hypothetical protein